MPFSLDTYLNDRRARIEFELQRVIPDGTPASLAEATAYSLLAGGKRLRPIMTVAACEAVGGTIDEALAPALALEMIHTYSLIHDDLPAMDNDDMRRGRPTNHKKFGEAMAILAGDALLTDAFFVLGRAIRQGGVYAQRAALACAEVANAAGSSGMVGGQVLDIQATKKTLSEADLIAIHHKKTGALFVAAVTSGAIMGGADTQTVARMRGYGEHAGLGFQIIDDVLDVTQDLKTLGKPPGSDAAAGKTTYVDVLGIEGARKRARACLDLALSELLPLGEKAQALIAIAQHLIDRDR